MYFREKEDTNIDSEFEKDKKADIKLNLKKVNPKILLFAGIGIIILLLTITIIFFSNKTRKYTIELLGDEVVTIGLGTDYIEQGYKAYDKNKKDYTNQVEITSTVDISKPGEYEILYSIDNINKVRRVIVSENVSKTYIRLNGKIEMYLSKGEKYTEPGYVVYDSIDKNLNNEVKITGNVDTSKVGTYVLTYSVINSRNITTTVTRTVHIVNK